jgi:hypothetical protein
MNNLVVETVTIDSLAGRGGNDPGFVGVTLKDKENSSLVIAGKNGYTADLDSTRHQLFTLAQAHLRNEPGLELKLQPDTTSMRIDALVTEHGPLEFSIDIIQRLIGNPPLASAFGFGPEMYSLQWNPGLLPRITNSIINRIKKESVKRQKITVPHDTHILLACLSPLELTEEKLTAEEFVRYRSDTITPMDRFDRVYRNRAHNKEVLSILLENALVKGLVETNVLNRNDGVAAAVIMYRE